MSTLDKLQALDDGKFHQLADAILKRVDSKYRDLRTHGVNDQGISIKGQPDSYVGNSARSCTIAFCYTVAKGDWWNKVCADVSTAIKTSSNLKEIVIALPRDVDREGPKDTTIIWEDRIRTAASNKPFIVYDGRKLSGLLDEKYQDLRYEHLEIPFSHLSGAAIVLSCQKVTRAVTADFKAKGRYDPLHYIFRDADNQLKQLWREAFGSQKERRLIPMVNDSGIGKTSLCCSFAESSGESVPVLLMQARDCGFHSEDSLVRTVMQKLQGVLSPTLQMQEEVALARTISTLGVLTVVLDGLDEVRNSQNVRRAIKFWLESAIGKVSILLVSSRPDFWRRCSEKSWERWVAVKESNDRTSASTCNEQLEPPEQRILGYTLPEKFSSNELGLAWNTFGLPASSLDRATTEVRQELSHPFTLKAWVDVFKAGKVTKLPSTRGEIIQLWIKMRLKGEEDFDSRISNALLWKAMIEVAKSIDASGETYISVDKLSNVPRFDSAHPPGEVVQRLINVNLLEFVEEQKDSVRFVLETVYEFFLAEADAEAVRNNIQLVVSSFGGKKFSKTVTRLGRLGFRIADCPEADAFATAMTCQDYAKALAIIQGRPHSFSPECRRFIFNKCRESFALSSRPEMAFLVERIGYVNCDEARETLAALVLPWETCPPGLRLVAAYGIVRLNLISGIPLLFGACWWFDGHHSYYHRDILSLLRSTSNEFREALAAQAILSLAESSEDLKHAQAVTVLGYLGDERLVEHLNERLRLNNGLYGYENHALFAVGSPNAAEVFAKFANLSAAKIEAARGTKDEEVASRIWYDVALRSADLLYLVTEPFEKCLISLIDGTSPMATRFAIDISNLSCKPALIRHVLFSEKVADYQSLNGDEIAKSISASDWLDWWGQASTDSVKTSLLRFSGKIPDVRLETIAMDCLKISELRGSAANALARIGTSRCLPLLRQTLALVDVQSSDAFYLLHGLVHALGELRDVDAVDSLAQVACDNPHHVRPFALDALAKIGTETASVAIIKIAENIDFSQPHNNCLIEALIADGSLRAVHKAIEIARGQPGGPKWLVKQLRHVFMIRGHTVGRFYRHVQDAELVTYLLSVEAEMSPDEKRYLIRCFEQIDSDNVRQMLWTFAKRAGTEKDVKIVILKNHDGYMLSSEARRELVNRADADALAGVISFALTCKHFIFDHQLEQLANFHNLLVVSDVKNRLKDPSLSAGQTIRLLSILGAFGSSEDTPDVKLHLDNANESVRNACDEALKLLSDPLRLSEAWKEMWIER